MCSNRWETVAHVQERDALTRTALPVLRAVCSAKGLTFTEVDLRWGITGKIAWAVMSMSQHFEMS